MSVARPELDGKVAVVTGGGSGLGWEIAVAMHAAGARVVLSGRDGAAVAAAADRLDPGGGLTLGVPCDVRSERAVSALAAAACERFGRIDVLVNNSGIAGPTAPLWETTYEDWQQAVATNLLGTFLCCRAVLPVMVAQRGGSIVTIGSMSGKRPLFGRTSYAASKSALVGLTRTLALEAGPYGIRVNLVSPGPLEGERIRRVFEAQAAARGIAVADARHEMVADSPLGRLVPARDVAGVVTFLAGDTAASITGEDVNVSAGIVMH